MQILGFIFALLRPILTIYRFFRPVKDTDDDSTATQAMRTQRKYAERILADRADTVADIVDRLRRKRF
jgi:hypothetical protein